VISHYNPQPK